MLFVLKCGTHSSHAVPLASSPQPPTRVDSGSALAGARGFEHVRQGVVPLVTRELQDALAGVRGERHHKRPGSRPGGGVVDSDGPFDSVRRGASETLDETECRRPGVPIRAPLLEIPRLHDECVAIPMTSRIAHIEPDRRTYVRCALQRNDPRLVH